MQRLLISWSPECALWKYGWSTWHRTLFSRCELNLTFPKRPAMNSSSRCPLPTPHATTERRFSPTRFIRRHALPCLRSASPRRQINAVRWLALLRRIAVPRTCIDRDRPMSTPTPAWVAGHFCVIARARRWMKFRVNAVGPSRGRRPPRSASSRPGTSECAGCCE